MKSEKYNLILQDLKKLGIGALIASAGAALTYVEKGIVGIDFGALTELVVVLNSIGIAALRKYLSETNY